MNTPAAAAAQLAEHLASRPATLGDGRLVCIDGPSGSGKTTLAEHLVVLAPATVLHTDELCPGWAGLPSVPAILTALLTPLAAGQSGRYRAWDWIEDRPAETRVVEPAALLVIEGLGSGAQALSGWTTTLVWMDAAPAERKVRALERDGDDFRSRWETWASAEAAYFEAEQVARRADLVFRTG